MFFHKPDKTLARIKSCAKRAKSLGQANDVPDNHPLSPAFYNMIMALDASDSSVEDLVYDLLLLDWFAEKLDSFSKNNMLSTDPAVRAMLYQWQQRLPVNYEA